ncbi:Uncharacterised protein [Bordetella pertussis]|nr:Uncharacterised protein [Bordetella pertussis]
MCVGASLAWEGGKGHGRLIGCWLTAAAGLGAPN